MWLHCCKIIIVCLSLLLPILSFAQPLTEIQSCIGTPENPTIEGGVINTPYKKQADIDFTKDTSDEFSDDQHIKSILKNAAKDGKLAYVLQRAEQLKLPATVALIPMIESHYQTNTVSPKGAKGAWQLMPNTANDYGLDSKSRKNFIASTDTALHLLSDLYQQFGNWTLAFAAYNAGSTRVKCVLARGPDTKRIDELDLPLETKRYIAKLKMLYQAMSKLSTSKNKVFYC